MKITPEQAREALDAWICRPGMTQEQAIDWPPES
ncbi:hypothetical protein Q2452_24080, partial [Escherichia coli]|nr:hypothetical protein [Escherichia coli]